MDNFDGKRFHNLVRPRRARRSGDILRWLRTRRPGNWAPVPDAPVGPPPPRRVSGGTLRVTLVNHATLLLQTRGLNILTDPIWSERASASRFIGPRRYRPPGIRFADLPPVDAVLVSHDHYDHLDVPTLRDLAHRDAPRFFTGIGNRRRLERAGIGRVTEMAWWDRAALDDSLALVAAPAQHWSGRGLFDHKRTLWLSFLIDAPDGPVYFAGDTGMGPHFEMVRDRFGPPRLAMLPIGAYLPRWFMNPIHLSPRQAVRAHRLLDARVSIAMHYGTFALGDDSQHRPVAELERARELAGMSPEAFRVLPFGQGDEIPPLETRIRGTGTG